MSYASREGRVRIAQPGDVIGVEEEFYPSEGVYVDASGFLRATVIGELQVDVSSKIARVTRFKQPLIPRPGSNVVGVVTSVRHDIVLVELYGLIALTPKVTWLGEFSGIFTGGIPIAQVSGEFIRDLNEYYRVGDVVIARVISSSSPYQLTTKPPQYGVVYALCSNCLTPLEPLNQRSMRCPNCGNVEARKVSILASSRVLLVDIKRLLALKRW